MAAILQGLIGLWVVQIVWFVRNYREANREYRNENHRGGWKPGGKVEPRHPM